VTEAEFKKSLFELLKKYEDTNGVCLTVNSILFGESMYPGKYPCSGEPVAMIFISVNPIRVPEGIAPHIEWLANSLATLHNQYVVPCSAISPADSTILGRK
jgi:hypothetical protein